MARKETTDKLPENKEEIPGVDESYEVATQGEMGIELGGMDGEEDNTITLPAIKLIYGVSKLIDTYNVGDIVLNDDTLLATKGTPIHVIVLHTRTYFKEWFTPEERVIAKAENRMEKMYASREAAEADGQICPTVTGGWPNNTRPTVGFAMTLDVLIQKPEGLVSGLFGVEIGDQVYAPARWYVDKTTYKAVGPIIMGARKLALKQRGLASGIFAVQSNVREVNGNSMPVFNVRLNGHLTDDEFEQLQKLFA